MKISCVVPTKDRPEFLPGIIKCFLDQDCRDEMELEILDDSTCPASVVPMREGNRRINYTWMNPKTFGVTRTGQKRNLVNTLTKGSDIIVHFDSDDWSHPSRVTSQIAFLLNSHLPVVGYHSLLYWEEKTAAGYRYNDPTFRPHAAGSSLCYYHDWWSQHAFTDRQVAEDYVFCIDANRNGNLASQDGGQMLVARSHGGNTCRPDFGSKKYPPVDRSGFPEGFLLTLPEVQP